MYYMDVSFERFVWDEWNILHIAKHDVSPEEVESARAAGLILFRESYKGRLLLLGETTTGRVLAIVVGPVPGAEAGTWYPFSARTAHRSERRAYAQLTGGETP